MWAERLLCLKWIRWVFCFAHGTECNAPQSARSHSKEIRGRSAAPSALTAAAGTGGRGRLQHAVGWRVLDFRRFIQNEKCSADRLHRIILRTRSNQTAPSCETTWDPTLSSQRLLLLLLSVYWCIPWEPSAMQSASFFSWWSCQVNRQPVPAAAVSWCEEAPSQLIRPGLIVMLPLLNGRGKRDSETDAVAPSI